MPTQLEQKVQLEYLTQALPPIFCVTCGSKMYPTEVRDLVFGGKYDRTGKRQHIVIFKCSNLRWYHFGMGHEPKEIVVKERQ